MYKDKLWGGSGFRMSPTRIFTQRVPDRTLHPLQTDFYSVIVLH